MHTQDVGEPLGVRNAALEIVRCRVVIDANEQRAFHAFLPSPIIWSTAAAMSFQSQTMVRFR